MHSMWVKGRRLDPAFVKGCAPVYGFLEVDAQWGELRNGEPGRSDHRHMLPSLYEPTVKIKRGSIFVFGTEAADFTGIRGMNRQVWWCRPSDPPPLDGSGQVRIDYAASRISVPYLAPG